MKRLPTLCCTTRAIPRRPSFTTFPCKQHPDAAAREVIVELFDLLPPTDRRRLARLPHKLLQMIIAEQPHFMPRPEALEIHEELMDERTQSVCKFNSERRILWCAKSERMTLVVRGYSFPGSSFNMRTLNTCFGLEENQSADQAKALICSPHNILDRIPRLSIESGQRGLRALLNRSTLSLASIGLKHQQVSSFEIDCQILN